MCVLFMRFQSWDYLSTPRKHHKKSYFTNESECINALIFTWKSEYKYALLHVTRL